MNKLYALGFVLYPILSNYGVGSFDFGLLLSFILLLLSVMTKGISFDFPKYFILFIAYAVVTRMLWATSLSTVISPGFVLYCLVIGMYCKRLKFDLVYNYYKKVVIICCAFFFFQQAYLFLTGNLILGLIPGIPTYDELDGDHIILMQRPASFFSEPAKLIQYILPLLMIELFKDGEKSKYLIVNIFTLLLLTASGNAVIGLLIVTVGGIFNYWKDVSIIKKIIIVPIIVLGVSFGVFKYLETEVGQKIIDRTEELDSSGDKSSGFIRIYRGFVVYSELNLLEKITGINNPTRIEQAISTSNVNFMFKKNDTYFNNIQSVLMNTGLIGLFIYSLVLGSFIRKSVVSMKMVTILYIALSFVASMYLSWQMLFFLILPYIHHKSTIVHKK